MIFGNIKFNSGYNFTLSGGTLKIDGNTGVGVTSVANGTHLFDAGSTGVLNINGGSLQFINPPYGPDSETLVSIYNFNPDNTVHFGDGISTIESNNPNGFGGLGFPSQIGKLIIDPVTSSGNRVFRVIKPLTVKVRCEVISGNLIQEALLTVEN